MTSLIQPEMQIDDEFSYMRDPKWPDVTDSTVLDFLNERNKECEEYFKEIGDLKEELYQEIINYISLEDKSIPRKNGDYWYYGEISEDEHYWKYLRFKDEENDNPELLLDVNEIAKDFEFCNIKGVSPSPENKYLAYCQDITGSERYVIKVMEIATRKIVDEAVTDAFSEIIWHENQNGFFYIPCGDNWRALKVNFHLLGTEQSSDQLIYDEQDNTYHVNIDKTLSKRFLVISPKSGDCNEISLLDLHSTSMKPELFKSREDNHLSYLTHSGDNLYVQINDKGKNYRILSCKIGQELASAREFLAHSNSRAIETIECYQDHIVVESRNKEGLKEIQLYSLNNYKPIYTVNTNQFTSHKSYDLGYIPSHFDAKTVTFEISTLAMPTKVYELDYTTGEARLIKQSKVNDKIDPNRYTVKRAWAQAQDGVMIPISILYRTDLFKNDGSNPAYLYGYGSYGISVDPNFRASAVCLADHGYVFAIAHIRGGGDLGHYWYEAAKYLTKKKTFEDFIAAAQYLANHNYTSKGKITISGGSAGGLLIGYSIIQAPELFKAAALHVPFVDVLNTMLDDSLPLTVGEFKEWGNPKDPEFYEYMKSYSPYDNVKEQSYPHIFMTAGLTDPRVGYWEPAKFWLKLQKMRTNENLLLLKTQMSAGHFGHSSRFEMYREKAEELAFMMTATNK